MRPSLPTGGNIPAAGEGSIGDPSKYKAGDGVAADVAVSQKSDITVAGGQGATPGSSEVAKTYDPDAEGSDPAPSIEKRFRDVDPNAWYAPGVKKVADAGLMRGYSEASLFGVGASLTRSELAMVLWRYSDPAAEGSYDASAAKNETSLPDVRDGRVVHGCGELGGCERRHERLCRRDERAHGVRAG